MADRKQLKILKQGVAAWNAWRQENPDAKINLRMMKADKRWKNLRTMEVKRKCLKGVNLRDADIKSANFIFTDLSKADFTKAKAGTSLFGTIVKFLLLAILIIIPVNVFVELLFLIPYSKTEVSSIILLFLGIIHYFLVSDDAIYFILFFVGGGFFLDVSNNIILISFVVLVYLFFVIKYVIHRILHEDPQIASFRNIILSISTKFGTDFRGADLTDAVFDNACLKYSRFDKADLTGTSWRHAQGLQSISCWGTVLFDRDVRELLVYGKGEGQSFKGKNLSGAYLAEADLRNTDLRETDLMQANLCNADITGAKLYGSARENWIIDGIRCDYVYWDEAGKERTPPDRDFRPGEFEELYKQLPTFEYIFEQGFTPLDPLVMDRVVQAINERHNEFKLDLINFDKRGQPHATFTVCHLDFVDTAKEQVNTVYEANRVQPENQEQLMAAFMGLIENQSKSLDIIKQLGGSEMGDTYNISGGQVGAVGKSAIATGNTFQQIINDLSRLHEEMQRTASNPEQQAAAQDVAKAEQAAQQEDEPAMRQHLKNAGQWTLDCAQKIGTDVVTEYLKKMTTGM
ncbi:MAG: hypothetical protein D3920_14065 [Candidatus Electrothrix sp. AW2]|nr:hypothetical protein [Candidatus Electrothrix gigas]